MKASINFTNIGKIKSSFLLFSTMLFLACNPVDHDKEVHLSSDLESVSGDHFKSTTSVELSGASFQTDELARSGKYAIKLSSKNNKGLEGSIENIKIGDQIHIKVWRAGKDKKNGVLHLGAGYLYAFETKEAVKKEGEWELLEFDLALPVEFPGKGLRWYVYYEGESEVYFDDLSLSLKRNNGLQIKTHETLPQVKLQIPMEGLLKLEEKKEKALEDGILISTSKDWVKSRLEWGDENKKVKVRLKGDWTDHLYGEKFSLRVNVSKGKTLGSYSKFGIQKPGARYYLDEWFIHQLLMDEGVLTTRYEFVDFYINDESKGIYAIEEHFTPELLTSQNRKEGLLFKFNEDELWSSRHKNNMLDIMGVPWYESANIEAFSFDEVLEDEVLRKDFFIARDLMYQYQFKLGTPSNYIDLMKMAAYIAMMDLCSGYHSLVWHNQRFYYNQSTQLLEPVVYDIFQENSHIVQSPISFVGLEYVEHPNSYSIKGIDFLFLDSLFVKHYVKYLEKFAAPSYFDDARMKFKTQLERYEKEIHEEYDFYSFDISIFEKRAAQVREEMPRFKVEIEKKLKENRKPSRFKIAVPDEYYPIKNVSLEANLNFDSGKTELEIWNFYFKEIEVIDLMVNDKVLAFPIPNRLPPYIKTVPPKTNTITIDNIPSALRYKIVGQDSIYVQKITKFRLPKYRSNEKKSE